MEHLQSAAAGVLIIFLTVKSGAFGSITLKEKKTDPWVREAVMRGLVYNSYHMEAQSGKVLEGCSIAPINITRYD